MKKIFYILLSLTFLSTPLFALGQNTVVDGDPNPNGGSGMSINLAIGNPFRGGNDLASVVNTILQNVIMPLATVLVVLAIIYSGYKFVVAQGKPEEITKAKQGLLYVLIGAGILLGATGISAAIQGTLKPLLNI